MPCRAVPCCVLYCAVLCRVQCSAVLCYPVLCCEPRCSASCRRAESHHRLTPCIIFLTCGQIVAIMRCAPCQIADLSRRVHCSPLLLPSTGAGVERSVRHLFDKSDAYRCRANRTKLCIYTLTRAPSIPQLTFSHTCICLWQARTNGQANCDAGPGLPAKHSPLTTYAEDGRRRASSGGMARWRGRAGWRGGEVRSFTRMLQSGRACVHTPRC